MVLKATTGAFSDMNTLNGVLKLVNANLGRSAMKKTVQDVNNKLDAIVVCKNPFKAVRQLIEKEQGTTESKG